MFSLTPGSQNVSPNSDPEIRAAYYNPTIDAGFFGPIVAVGDYVWIDADPEDRPYRDWKKNDPYYEVARVMMRVRVYSGMPRGVPRSTLAVRCWMLSDVIRLGRAVVSLGSAP